MKINPGETVTISVQSSNATDPPVSVQWKPGPGKTNLTITLTNAAGDEEDHTFHVNAAAPKGATPEPPTPEAAALVFAGVFQDVLLTITDNGDGQNLHVQKGPEGFTVPMALVDGIIAGGQDAPNDFYVFNFAARLARAGIASVQTAPDSGVASPAALSFLNAASYKGY